MKKTGVLNQQLSHTIAGLGHMDTIVIADAGLPVPADNQRIDLALTQGVPGFIETLRVVLEEVQVELAIIAEEMINLNPLVYGQLQALLSEIPIETVSHREFKERTVSARAVVRTGEFSPYANVILVSGVVF
jgi:D-ribose pyranase